jgi:hypothetical protein
MHQLVATHATAEQFAVLAKAESPPSAAIKNVGTLTAYLGNKTWQVAL